MERTEVKQLYIHFPLCCSHAQQTLSRPQPVPVAAKKRLAWLLIITSRIKVLVLGPETKSILKICIWQQLGVLGRASHSEQKQGTHVTTTEK